MEIRKRVSIASVKIFYRPDEATEQFGITEEVLLKIATSVGAVYKIGYIYLINIMYVADAVAGYKEFTDKRGGAYVRTSEAIKELGLPEELVLYIASRAHALYEVGGEKLIDVKEVNTYIKRFPIEADIVVPELQKRPRGSKFIREIRSYQ